MASQKAGNKNSVIYPLHLDMAGRRNIGNIFRLHFRGYRFCTEAAPEPEKYGPANTLGSAGVVFGAMFGTGGLIAVVGAVVGDPSKVVL